MGRIQFAATDLTGPSLPKIRLSDHHSPPGVRRVPDASTANVDESHRIELGIRVALPPGSALAVALREVPTHPQVDEATCLDIDHRTRPTSRRPTGLDLRPCAHGCSRQLNRSRSPTFSAFPSRRAVPVSPVMCAAAFVKRLPAACCISPG